MSTFCELYIRQPIYLHSFLSPIVSSDIILSHYTTNTTFYFMVPFLNSNRESKYSDCTLVSYETLSENIVSPI